MEEYHVVVKPNPRDPEILWEDYFNKRIVYNVKADDTYVRASVAIGKTGKDIDVFLEFNTENTDFELEISIVDDKGKRVDIDTVTNRRKIKGFFVEKICLQYRVLSRIDKVIVSQIK